MHAMLNGISHSLLFMIAFFGVPAALNVARQLMAHREEDIVRGGFGQNARKHRGGSS